MIRIPRWDSSSRSLGFELRLLEFLAHHISVQVPSPEMVGTLPEPEGWPYLVYPKISGVPLRSVEQLTRTERESLGNFLKKLFSDLGQCPPGALVKIGARRGDPTSYSERFERLQRRYRQLGAGRLPDRLATSVTIALQTILSTLAVSRYRPVLIHNDLWPSHILWNRRAHRPVAVIDWEDARLGDPAADLAAFAGLGAEILVDVAKHRRQRSDSLFWKRLSLYRAILPLGGYLFGLDTKNRAIASQHLVELRTSLHGSGLAYHDEFGRPAAGP